MSVCVALICPSAWGQSCGGYNGAPGPAGGPIALNNGAICLNKPGAPGEISIKATNVDDGDYPANFGVEIDWDDGSPRQVITYGGSIPVVNVGPHSYEIPSITHTFLPRACTATGTGMQCAYRPRIHLRLAGVTCLAQFGTSPDFFRFNTDDQCSGNLSLSETLSNAPVFMASPGEVVTFSDRTTLNCLPPAELTALNSMKRWRRFVYGPINTITGSVLVNGTATAFPYSGTVEVSSQPLSTSRAPFSNNNTRSITIPVTAQVGEEFYVRMDYWNYCNPYGTDAPISTYGIIRVGAPQSQSISFPTPGPVTYGDAPFNLAASATSGLPVSFTSNNPDIALVTGNSVVIVGAGRVTITASQIGNSSFLAATPVARILDVTKATLTIRADAKSKTYGSENPVLSMSITGFKNGDTTAELETLPTVTTTADRFSHVGTYNLVPAGGVGENYTFVYANGALTISQATLAVSVANATRTYGDTNPEFSLQYAGFKNADTHILIDTPPAVTTPAAITSDVGNYDVIPSGGADNDYTFHYVNGTLNITKALLRATGSSGSRSFGQANPSLSISYSGFKNADLADVLDSPAVVTTPATNASDAGTYPVTVGGGADNNYALNYVDGLLTIIPATQSLVFNSLNDVSELVGSIDLTATASSTLPVIFTLSSADKASLTASTLTILKPGTVTIMATQPGNNNYAAAPAIVRTFCIVPAKPTLTVSSEGAGYALVSSSGVGNSWYKNGNSLETETGISLIATETGFYQVRVSVDGCTSELSDKAELVITSLEMPKGDQALNIYPNPATSDVRIEHQGKWTTSYNGFVYNSRGEVIERLTQHKGPFMLPISHYKPDIYTVLITDGKVRWTGKFVKN